MILFLFAAQLLSPAGERPVPAYAQADTNAGTTRFEGGTMWRDFGGAEGVSAIVDDLVQINITDPRIADIFKGQDLIRLRRELKSQFCYILNGGCHYDGRSMAEAHRNMGVQRADMNALVENLQKAMSANHVPFPAQNRFLAKLAPMERDIATH